MSRRHVARIAALATAAAALPLVPGAFDASAEGPVTVGTPNMSFVANVAYPIQPGYATPEYKQEDAELFENTRPAGTDLELITLTVDHDDDAGTDPEPRDFAVAGSYRNGLQLVDVTDPTQPRIAQTFSCGIAQGDIQLFHRTVAGRERTYVAYAQDDISSDRKLNTDCFLQALAQEGYAIPEDPDALSDDDADVIDADGGVSGTFLIDITEPYHTDGADQVRVVGWARWPAGSHNATVDPTGRYLFNSNQDLLPYFPGDDQPAFQIEVFDLGDPDEAGLFHVEKIGAVPLTTGVGPHDITFNESGDRAYVAAISHTVVLDTTDPAHAAVIGVIEDPAISIHHQADPIPVKHPVLGDRTLLVVSDELAGVIQGAGACPGGGLHVYDVTGDLERSPVKVGYFAIPEIEPRTQYHLRCTAHVFRTYDLDGDGGHDRMTIAWYGAGVRVVDLNGLTGISAGAAPVAGSLGTAPVEGMGMREAGAIWLPEILSDDVLDEDGEPEVVQVGSQAWAAKVLRWEADGSAYIFTNDQDRGLDVFRFDGSGETGVAGTWLNPTEALARAQVSGVLAARAAGGQSLPYCVVLPEQPAAA